MWATREGSGGEKQEKSRRIVGCCGEYPFGLGWYFGDLDRGPSASDSASALHRYLYI
jgi:hypothetical protein